MSELQLTIMIVMTGLCFMGGGPWAALGGFVFSGLLVLAGKLLDR